MERMILSDQEIRKTNPNNGRTSSGMTTLIQRYSFGLIKTDIQAVWVQVSIIIIGLVWFFITLVTMGATETATIELTPELINAEQPIGSL